jgi:hypothetical protein
VTGLFANALIVAGLVIAAWSLIQLIANWPIGRPLRIAMWALELMVVVFAIGGIVQMFTADHDFTKIEFVGYLLGMCLIPLGALWWTRTDTSRAGTAVLLVIGLVTSILVLRVQQVWIGPHA